MHRFAVDLAVDGEVVVQDRVGADRVDADLVADASQRAQQFGADLLAAGQVGAEQLGQPLAADHRLPRAVQGHAVADGLDVQVDDWRLGGLRQCSRHDRGAQSTGDRHLRHRCDGIGVCATRLAGRVDVPRVGHGQHVAALVVDRLEITVRRAVRASRCAVHE